ncbi:hypothetical protein PoB_003306200 [Plakobranchus ocellatus]|uniref:Uncharacterized protein n=1 Tax=Plakobranchus ocellatus TaxID=259542 RepID=A0AAV4AHQ3_9GAST|nr:hypothetical protein PoB_003306200 [Plakobranchus ocellatus]
MLLAFNSSIKATSTNSNHRKESMVTNEQKEDPAIQCYALAMETYLKGKRYSFVARSSFIVESKIVAETWGKRVDLSQVIMRMHDNCTQRPHCHNAP